MEPLYLKQETETMNTDTNIENRDRASRLKFTLYTESETRRSIDDAYSNYCQSITDSRKLVRPLSKSSWIISLVRRGIQDLEACNETIA